MTRWRRKTYKDAGASLQGINPAAKNMGGKLKALPPARAKSGFGNSTRFQCSRTSVFRSNEIRKIYAKLQRSTPQFYTPPATLSRIYKQIRLDTLFALHVGGLNIFPRNPIFLRKLPEAFGIMDIFSLWNSLGLPRVIRASRKLIGNSSGSSKGRLYCVRIKNCGFTF